MAVATSCDRGGPPPGSARHPRWSGPATPARVRVAALPNGATFVVAASVVDAAAAGYADGVHRTSQRGAPPRAQPPVFRSPQICGPTETRHPARRTFRAPYRRLRYAARNQEAGSGVGRTVVRSGCRCRLDARSPDRLRVDGRVWRCISRQHGQRSNSSIRSLAVFPQQTRNHDISATTAAIERAVTTISTVLHSSPMK